MGYEEEFKRIAARVRRHQGSSNFPGKIQVPLDIKEKARKTKWYSEGRNGGKVKNNQRTEGWNRLDHPRIDKK